MRAAFSVLKYYELQRKSYLIRLDHQIKGIMRQRTFCLYAS